MSKTSNKGDPSSKLSCFFAILADDLASKSGSFRSEFQTEAISRQSKRARKRALLGDPDLSSIAVRDFVSTNSKVGSTVLCLDQDLVNNARLYITVALEKFSKSLDPSVIQTPLDPDILYSFWRFGPGTSNGIRGTHCAEKITQDMTVTPRCLPFIVKLRRDCPYFQLNDERNGRSGHVLIKGSRLSTVQKNEDTDRTIAIEPSGNMAMQLAAGSYLEGALRTIGLDIRFQQEKNKSLAERGSRENSLATVDLKSASDMISMDLVRLLLPPDWYELLVRLRSQVIEVEGEWIEMNMMSTMGNGFTFPLMTLILVSLIYAYRSLKGGPTLFIDWTHTAVFGDDIIVPSHEYERLCEVLDGAGLIVNHDKSYSVGHFRESCGGDFHKGVDITPFYVKTLADDSSIYVAINQTIDWCVRHNVWLFDTVKYLMSLLDGKMYLIPEWHDPSEGVLTSQVNRRFKALVVKRHTRRLKASLFDMMLISGGFVTSAGPYTCYTPRMKFPKRKVRNLRLPKGHLSGWDPRKRSQIESNMVSMFLEIV